MNTYMIAGLLLVKSVCGANHPLGPLIIKGDVAGIEQKISNGTAELDDGSLQRCFGAYSILSWTVARGEQEAVFKMLTVLLAAGVDALKVDDLGENPLYTCLRSKESNLHVIPWMKLLIDAGTNSDIRMCDESGHVMTTYCQYIKSSTLTLSWIEQEMNYRQKMTRLSRAAFLRDYKDKDSLRKERSLVTQIATELLVRSYCGTDDEKRQAQAEIEWLRRKLPHVYEQTVEVYSYY